MSEQESAIEQFLSPLSLEEKRDLFNDLLAIEAVYRQNRKTTFYTFRKIRQASRRHVECRKRTLQFRNLRNDELVISQIHEQHLFKNHYHFKVFFNMEEQSFEFVEQLLDSLRKEQLRYYTSQTAYA